MRITIIYIFENLQTVNGCQTSSSLAIAEEEGILQDDTTVRKLRSNLRKDVGCGFVLFNGEFTTDDVATVRKVRISMCAYQITAFSIALDFASFEVVGQLDEVFIIGLREYQSHHLSPLTMDYYGIEFLFNSEGVIKVAFFPLKLILPVYLGLGCRVQQS